LKRFCVGTAKKMPMDDVTFVVGQLAGPGTYQCQACGLEVKEYALSFEIEPCPCGGTTFKRID
jgi:Zinc-ribbon containing domain